MVIFLILGILFFPRIIADEIKISEDGSVRWIRNSEGNQTDDHSETAYVNDTGKDLVAVNPEMKYIIESPLTTTIGKLEKETKIEGCQYRGCNLILRFGDGTVFHEESIDKSIDKIVIDLGPGQGQ